MVFSGSSCKAKTGRFCYRRCVCVWPCSCAKENLKECIVQGKAAAARAATVISKDMLETEGIIAKV